MSMDLPGNYEQENTNEGVGTKHTHPDIIIQRL